MEGERHVTVGVAADIIRRRLGARAAGKVLMVGHLLEYHPELAEHDV